MYDIASNQILSQPVSGFLQGRAMRQAERESDQSMEIRGAREAREKESFQISKDDHEAQLDEVSAKRSLAGAQQVLAAPKGQRKAFAEKNFPDFVKQHPEWQQFDETDIEEMAQGVVAKSAAHLGISPAKPEAYTLSPGQVRFEGDQAVAGVDPAPEKSNPDYEKFLLAQKDPQFKSFLMEMKGKGMSMTLPDGTVIEMGGSGGGVSPGELKTPTVTKLQDSIVGATDELDRLNNIGKGFDPKFLQIPGRLKGSALKIKDLAGGMLGDMTSDETKYLTKFATFKADANKNLSLILNRLSGAAISPTEGERLKKGIPNDEDSPTEFVAKYNASVKDASRVIMRANWALKNGIGVKSVDQLSKVMPLGSIDQVYADFANAEWQKLGGTPETKAQAIQKANQEFGLAR